MKQKNYYLIFILLIITSSLIFLNFKKTPRSSSHKRKNPKVQKIYNSPFAGKSCNPNEQSFFFHEKSQTYNICKSDYRTDFFEGDGKYPAMRPTNMSSSHHWVSVPNFVKNIRTKDIDWRRDPKKDKCLLRSYELKDEHFNDRDYQKAFFDRSSFHKDLWKPDHLGHNRNSLAYHEDKGKERSRFPPLIGELKAKVIFYFDKNFKEDVEEYLGKKLDEFYKDSFVAEEKKIKIEDISEEIIASLKRFLSGEINKQTFIESMPKGVRFKNHVDFWELIEFYENYFKTQSFGRLNYQVDRSPILVEIDRKGETEKHKITKMIMAKLSSNELNNFEAQYDFAILVGVGTTKSEQRKPTGFSFINDYGDKDPVEHLGTNITHFTMVNWRFNSKVDRQYYVLPHESMHMHGLPDLYYKGSYNDLPTWRMARGYDLMYDSVGSGLNGYTKWVYGWIPDSQVECIEYMDLPFWDEEDKSSESSSIFTISHLNSLEYLFNNNSLKKLIVIKGRSDRHAIILERRGSSWGDYDIDLTRPGENVFENEGVLIYSVDSISVTAHHVNRPDYLMSEPLEKRVNRTTVPLMLARSDWSTVDKKLYLYDLKEALNYIKRNYPQYNQAFEYCKTLVDATHNLNENLLRQNPTSESRMFSLLQREDPLNKKRINSPRQVTDCINNRTSNIFHRLINMKDELYDQVWNEAYLLRGEALENYPIRAENLTNLNHSGKTRLKIWRTRVNQTSRDSSIKFLDF